MPTFMAKIRELIPPLYHKFHKGQAGRIGVIGGSEEYTGAPYFSSISSMLLGADLAHVICEPSAAVAIKSYSPDLIVHPYLRTEKNLRDDIQKTVFQPITDLLPRLHVLVVGPGLSRDKCMLEAARHAIQEAKKRNMPIVIDADGLYLIQHQPDVIHGYTKAVLTPNIAEFKRLCQALDITDVPIESTKPVCRLSHKLGGVTIVRKGPVDMIASLDTTYQCDTQGGLKRVGGQGDILSGLIACFLSWREAYHQSLWQHDHNISESESLPLVCYASCHLVRKCSRKAFEEHKRAMLASNMLKYIGPIFERHFARSASL